MHRSIEEKWWYRWGTLLVRGCEIFLTWRKGRRERRIARQQRHNNLVEWIKAFLWAAVMVLLINQYALQAYQIPSGSMRTTLVEGDRIFVGKGIYGPELLPGIVKLPGIKEPQRGEVVIFENPSYLSRGIVFELAQRFIYMLTLSIIDIDRDATGQQRAHFLIKRMVGDSEEYVRIEQGEFLFRAAAQRQWVSEEELMQITSLSYTTHRLVEQRSYNEMQTIARLLALQDLDAPLSSQQSELLADLWNIQHIDAIFLEGERESELFRAEPYNSLYASYVQRYRIGWYIPKGYMLPLGDNRDNSRDGRYFGVVAKKRVLGRARIKYWPLRRIGIIK